MGENINPNPKEQVDDLTPKGVLRKALELYESEEKSAADREAKLQVLKLIVALRNGQTDEYIKGYREGYTRGFSEGYNLRILEEQSEGRRYGDV